MPELNHSLPYLFFVDYLDIWASSALIIFFCLAPFKGRLLKPPLKIAATLFLMFVIFMITLLTIFYFFGETLFMMLAYGLGVVLLVILFLYYKKVIDDGVNKLLFVFFAALHISFFVDTPFVILQSFGIDTDTIAIRLLFIVFAIPLIWAYYRVLVPRLMQIDARHMKGLWLVPLALYVLGEILIMDDLTLDRSGAYMYSVYMAVSLLLYTLLIFMLSGLEKNIRYEFELSSTNRLLEMQREQYQRMAQNADIVKTMRHDIRHHLVAISQLTDEEAVRGYIADLSTQRLISPQEEIYCKNHAVNAVVAHYLGIAEKEGIAVETRLHVPEDVGTMPIIDLCVVMGNLLENALHACLRMTEGQRKIHATARVDGNALVIVIENSFDGTWREKDGVYLSIGADGESREGIGMVSVNSICKKHGGLLRVETDDGVWKSSALVELG